MTGADHRALHEILLDERIYADDGNSGKDDAGGLRTSGLVIETVATPSVWKLSLAATIR